MPESTKFVGHNATGQDGYSAEQIVAPVLPIAQFARELNGPVKTLSGHFADTAAADVLTTGAFIPAGGTTPRLLPDLMGDRINVKSFGAKGGGNATTGVDTLAFELAFAYAATRARANIYAPAGDYVIGPSTTGAGDFYLASISDRSNFSFTGDGPGVTNIRMGTNARRALMAFSNTSGIYVGGYRFDGNAANQNILGVHGLKFNNCTDLWINEIHLYDVAGYGMGLQNDYVTDASFQRIFITNFIIDTTTNDGIDVKNRNSQNLQIIIANGIIRNVQADKPGIDMRGQFLINNVSVELRRPMSSGFRFRPDSDDEGGPGNTGNLGGHQSCLSNFHVCGFGVEHTAGVVIDANYINVSNGVIEGCPELGVWTTTNAGQSQVSNVTVLGQEYTPLPSEATPNPIPIAGSKTGFGFAINGPDGQFTNCRTLGGSYGFNIQGSGVRMLAARADGGDTNFITTTFGVSFVDCESKAPVISPYVAGTGGDTFLGCSGFGATIDGVTADRMQARNTALAISGTTLNVAPAISVRVSVATAGTINSLGSKPNDEKILLLPVGTVLQNSATLILGSPTDVIIGAGTGDVVWVTSSSAGVYRVNGHMRSSGLPVTGGVALATFAGVGPTDDATFATVTSGTATHAVASSFKATVNSGNYGYSSTVGSTSERGHINLGDLNGQVLSIKTGQGGALLRLGPTQDLRVSINAARTTFNLLPLSPGGDNIAGNTLGEAALRWPVVYSATGTINTSDWSEKFGRDHTPLPDDFAVEPMTEAEIAAASALAREIGVYVFRDAVAAKGSDARLHVGLTVQRVMAIMETHGLDPLRYAFICHDAWLGEDGLPDTVEDVLDEDGEPTGETVTLPGMPARPAGSRYGFRPDELSLFIARGQEARMSALEASLAA